MVENKIKILTEYNALIDKEEAKKGNAIFKKEYKKLFDEIKQPLDKLNKENAGLEIVYFFDTNTNEFSIFRSNLNDDKSRTICVEFLIYLNQKASELLTG